MYINFVKIGTRYINLARITHAEHFSNNSGDYVKVNFADPLPPTLEPLTLYGSEAQELIIALEGTGQE